MESSPKILINGVSGTGKSYSIGTLLNLNLPDELRIHYIDTETTGIVSVRKAIKDLEIPPEKVEKHFIHVPLVHNTNLGLLKQAIGIGGKVTPTRNPIFAQVVGYIDKLSHNPMNIVVIDGFAFLIRDLKDIFNDGGEDSMNTYLKATTALDQLLTVTKKCVFTLIVLNNLTAKTVAKDRDSLRRTGMGIPSDMESLIFLPSSVSVTQGNNLPGFFSDNLISGIMKSAETRFFEPFKRVGETYNTLRTSFFPSSKKLIANFDFIQEYLNSLVREKEEKVP